MEPLPGPINIPRAKKGLLNQALGRSRGGISTKILDAVRYRSRHAIENAFARLKQFRSLATRFDKTARSYAAQVAIACIVVWLKL